MICAFDKNPLLFPKNWANEIVKWISGIHSPTGLIKLKNTLSPGEKSMSIDIDMENLLKELKGKLKQPSGEDNEQPKENNEDEQSGNACLYPFKTEKYSGQFIIYLPEESFIVDAAPVSITSGLTACEKGTSWYYLPTPNESTGNRWFLRIAESNDTISGSISVANTDNDTSVRFMPIASISADGEGTMQYIVGSIFGIKVADSSAASSGDDIGQITTIPQNFTVRRTYFTDKYSLNDIPEIWMKLAENIALEGTSYIRINNTNVGITEAGAISAGIGSDSERRTFLQYFRPYERNEYTKNSLKPLTTFRYLLNSGESAYRDVDWFYCGSKREFESGSFDIYALVFVVTMQNYRTKWATTEYYVMEYEYEDGLSSYVPVKHTTTTEPEFVECFTAPYTMVLVSTEPISLNDIQFTGNDKFDVYTSTWGSDVTSEYNYLTDKKTTTYKSERSYLPAYQLFAGKVATISDMEVTQVNTFTIDTPNVEFVVVFKDWDDTTLKTMVVAFNGTAVPPNEPTRAGYTFTGWGRTLEHILGDTTFTAVYVKYHTVTFKDMDGTTLKTEEVADGQDATPPSNPVKEGYTFNGWATSYTNITYDKVITATYVANE